MNTQRKLSPACIVLPDGRIDCGLPQNVCVVTRCNDKGVVCVQEFIPCAQPVHVNNPTPLALMVVLIVAVVALYHLRAPLRRAWSACVAWIDRIAAPLAGVIFLLCAWGVVGAMDEVDAHRAHLERTPTEFVHGGPEWEPCTESLLFKKAHSERDIRSLCTDDWAPSFTLAH